VRAADRRRAARLVAGLLVATVALAWYVSHADYWRERCPVTLLVADPPRTLRICHRGARWWPGEGYDVYAELRSPDGARIARERIGQARTPGDVETRYASVRLDPASGAFVTSAGRPVLRVPVR
jgi:hypothetical protein